ncbi:MAG: hypothetical protein WAS51_16935 [Ilumatobacteraceae bacterium]
MAIMLRPGTRLFSAVCTTELITVKAPAEPIELTIGGAPPVMSADERTAGTPSEGHDRGAALGKRYVDATELVELLCTKGGDGAPAVAGELMHVKGAKALPASD